MRSIYSMLTPELTRKTLSIEYRTIGSLCVGFITTPGISRCSASPRVSLIQVSITWAFNTLPVFFMVMISLTLVSNSTRSILGQFQNRLLTCLFILAQTFCALIMDINRFSNSSFACKSCPSINIDIRFNLRWRMSIALSLRSLQTILSPWSTPFSLVSTIRWSSKMTKTWLLHIHSIVSLV